MISVDASHINEIWNLCCSECEFAVPGLLWKISLGFRQLQKSHNTWLKPNLIFQVSLWFWASLAIMPKSSRQHKRQRREAQASMFRMMMPQMLPGPLESSSSSDEVAPSAPSAPSVPTAAPATPPVAMPAKKTEISRNITFVRSLSRKFLSTTVSSLVDALDSSWTADLSVNGLLALIYIFSRLKPNTPISQLRALAN